MSIEIKVPQLPESVEDAVVVAWHKQVGETIKRGENLLDLETDKVVLEVPAPQDGTLEKIVAEMNATVTQNDVLCLLGEAGSVAPAKSKPEKTKPAEESVQPVAEVENKAPVEGAAFGPAVRRLLAEHQLEASDIQGTGKGGRLTKADVLNYIDVRAQSVRRASQAAEPETSQPVQTPQTTVQTDLGQRLEQRVPMTRLRTRIAERLVEAQQTAAMLTTFNEVNLAEVGELRKKYKESFADAHGARLGYMSFFVKAAVEALKKFPIVNASIDGKDIVYHGYFDIGIAVSSPRGLVVPILRDADQLSFAEIEAGIGAFGEKAKSGSLTMDDLTGGTFTITNGGVFGSMLSTPILNPPQSAILGMHAINERVMIENGEMVVRPMMYLALSYDHRIIDGRDAVQFLVQIKNALEDPARLLLQI